MGRALSRPQRVSGMPISNLTPLKRRIEGISYLPYTVTLSGRDKVRPRTSRVRQSAAAGRRTGPIPPAESFVLAKTWPWGGGEDKVCGCRLNLSLISEVLPSLAARCISQSGSVLRRLYLRPQPHTTTIFPRDERLITPPHHPVRWPYRRRPHLLN